jgi:hypothetical protein
MALGKVFNLDFNKSGTMSLTAAMDILGYRCIHYAHYVDGGRHIRPLAETVKGNKRNGRRLLEGVEDYDFFSDFEGSRFVEGLDAQYPGSRFILTIRELNSWLESRRKNVLRNQQNPNYRYGWLEVDIDGWIEERRRVIDKLSDYFKNRKEDYLVIDICSGEGWKKLCGFLDKPIPEVPFPYLNKAVD